MRRLNSVIRGRGIIIAAAILVLSIQAFAFTGAGEAVAREFQNVLIANDSTNPVPVAGAVSVDQARQPFQGTTVVHIAEGIAQAHASIDSTPANKRLVIESVSIIGHLPKDQRITEFMILTSVGGTSVYHALSFPETYVPLGGHPDLEVASSLQNVRIYTDPGGRVLFSVARNDGGGSYPKVALTLSISGYLVDA